MGLVLEFDRHCNKPSVTNPSFGSNMPSEILNLAQFAPEHCDLEATCVIKEDVHRCRRQVVMIVKGLAQTLCQFTSLMIVDVDERRDGVSPRITLLLHLCHSCSGEVSNSLRSVLVAVFVNDPIESDDQLIVQGYRDTLHIPGSAAVCYDMMFS